MNSPVGTVGARGGTKCVDVALDKAIDVDEMMGYDLAARLGGGGVKTTDA